MSAPVAVVLVYANDCAHCAGKGRVPGGPYREQGEVVKCPHCGGGTSALRRVPWAEFLQMVRDGTGLP